jgi:protein SCO1/2
MSIGANLKEAVRGRSRRALVLSLLLVGAVPLAPAQKHSPRHEKRVRQPRQSGGGAVRRAAALAPTPTREVEIRGRRVAIPDASVVTQDGKRVRFYADLIEGKAVALGFFYTSCVFVCTRHGELFARIQRHAGERLGRDTFMVSVSMDPSTDTPARLTEWGASYGRKEGWTLVTGASEEVDKILKALTGNSVGPRDAHSSLFYVIDSKGRWEYMFGGASPEEVERQLHGSSSPQE